MKTSILRPGVLLHIINVLKKVNMNAFPESAYREVIKNKFFGVSEYRLPSGKIVDVLTKEYAIEVDFVRKWAESIGQSLQYGMETNKRPCIVFIYDSIQDKRLLDSVFPLLKRLCVTVYTIDVLTRNVSLRLI